MSADGDEMKALVLDECADKMRKAISHLQSEFAAVRTGRASSALVEKLKVDVYGSEVPLQQLAGFGVPEPRVLTISPYDKGTIKAIEKAIQQSDLGVNPSNDGQIIRLTFPELTEERRKDLVKVVRTPGRGGRGSRSATPGATPATSSRGSRRTARSARTTSIARRRTSRSAPTRSSPRSTRCSSTRRPKLLSI